MSVDKFGRIQKRKGAVVKGLPGIGFKLTADGDYDMENKRIKFLAKPVDEDDAINLEYVNKQAEQLKTSLNDQCKNRVKNCLKFHESKHYDAGGRKITNVALPQNDNDVINFKYVNELTGDIRKKQDDYFSTLKSTMNGLSSSLEKKLKEIDHLKKSIENINDVVYAYQHVQLYSIKPVTISSDGKYSLLGNLTEYKCPFKAAQIEFFNVLPVDTQILFDNVEGKVDDHKILLNNTSIGFKPSNAESNKTKKSPLSVSILLKYPIEIKKDSRDNE